MIMLTRTKILLGSISAAVLLGVIGGTATAQRGEGGGRGFGAGPGGMMFELFDTDGDGKVTRAELDQYRNQKFEEFDADQSGELSFEEYAALRESIRREMMEHRFRRHDDDNSGGLSRQEIGGRFDWMFERMDENDDGAIERSEMGGPH